VSVKVEQTPAARAGNSPLDDLFGANGSRGERSPRKSAGTAFVVDAAAGLLVTTDFVVAEAKTIEIVLDGGRAVPATVVATDEDSQLAVLRVDSAALRGLAALTWGDSTAARVGDAVVMVGYPYDFGKLASQGIVSGTSNTMDDGREYLVTDARILPGHAGGPLLDARGRVIGVAIAIYGPQGSSTTTPIGITLPSAIAQPAVEQLKRGPIPRGSLGIDVIPATQDDNLADGLQMPPRGAEVSVVSPGSGAAAAGLKPGDVIVRVDAQEVAGENDLRRYIRGKPPGAVVNVVFRRKGQEQSAAVTLGTRQP
jgi:S1-C subfamily serine protease